MTRVAAALTIVAGLALAVLPGLVWFRLGEVDATGIEASGALWVVPVLGLVAAELGMRAFRRALRGAPVVAVGGWMAAVGAVVLLWTLQASLLADVRLTARVDGRPVTLAVDPQRMAPSVLAPLAACVVVAAGLVLARPRLRWPR